MSDADVPANLPRATHRGYGHEGLLARHGRGEPGDDPEERAERGACLTDNSELAECYAGIVGDEDGDGVVLRLDDAALLAAVGEDAMRQDFPSLEEPINTVLGTTDDGVWESWSSSGRTWRDCLDIAGGCRVAARIPGASSPSTRTSRPPRPAVVDARKPAP